MAATPSPDPLRRSLRRNVSTEKTEVRCARLITFRRSVCTGKYRPGIWCRTSRLEPWVP
jgi:hypothetical protein